MQQQDEYLFELAPLGPEDLLSLCGEGPGNWWGEVDEDCLRVDERGHVVLVDPDVYYEVSNAENTAGTGWYTALWEVFCPICGLRPRGPCRANDTHVPWYLILR